MSVLEGYSLVAVVVGFLGGIVGWWLARRGEVDETGPHKLIEGIVDSLPPISGPFDEDAKSRWLDCMAYILDVVWPPPMPSPDPDDPDEIIVEGSLPLTSENVQKIMSDPKLKPPIDGRRKRA